jgi:hypothetical protein
MRGPSLVSAVVVSLVSEAVLSEVVTVLVPSLPSDVSRDGVALQASSIEARIVKRARIASRVHTPGSIHHSPTTIRGGLLSDEHVARIATASEQQLDLYIERILTAPTPEALFAN